MLANSEQNEALVGLFRKGTRLRYKKNEFIIRPGERLQGVYYINEGLVKAFDITRYGEENLLIVRKDQEIFPLIWAITGQERRVIYQALSPCDVWRISRGQFLTYLKDPSNPLSPLLDMTIEMYRIHSERIINLEYRSVRERLISFLITMCSRFGVETKKSIMINVPLRHQDIASSINATRETTGRELAILVRKGFVTNNQLMITIKDLEALKKLLD
ncbi:MAG TPA: Crp/Fnr family transcriptional regulator [Patescibacteria group bacterium]|nr:Crp/Fnr family transcriptional regulator [Patescibacteria group bacterium]